MIKVFKKILAFKRILVFSLLFSAAAMYAQVVTSVSGGEGILWAGGEYSRFQPDYGGVTLWGPAAIVDFNVTPKIGVLGEMRWLRWGNRGNGETQSDYLAGAKYRVYRIGRLDLDVKLLAGGVWMKFPGNIGSGSYFAYAPGVFADYRVSRKFLVRADYEYQFMPSAPNIPGQPDQGLTPNGFSIGVEYNILRTR